MAKIETKIFDAPVNPAILSGLVCNAGQLVNSDTVDHTATLVLHTKSIIAVSLTANTGSSVTYSIADVGVGKKTVDITVPANTTVSFVIYHTLTENISEYDVSANTLYTL